MKLRTKNRLVCRRSISREVSHTQNSRSFAWQSNASTGSKTEVMHLANLQVPANNLNFQGAGGISVQLPKSSNLANQINTLAKQPGNEYLGTLAARSDIDWKQVEVVNKTWDYKKSGLTQEATIIVAIVVTIFTAGAASSAGIGLASSAGFATATTAAGATVMATAGGAALAGATAAAITTLASSAAIAILNNKGDVAAALKEMGSKENVKNLVVAMATAGLVQGIGLEFGLNKINASSPFINQLGANMVNSVAGSLISTAVYGGNLEENLKKALITAFINTAGAQAAFSIGTLTNDNQNLQSTAEKFANKFAHAVLGCAMGVATADSKAGCGAGALGAVAGSLGAELFDPSNSSDPIKQGQAQQFGKLTASLAVMLAGGDANLINIAGMTAVNAVANNRQLHKDELALAKTLAEKAKALGLPISEEDIKVQMRLMGNRAKNESPNTPAVLTTIEAITNNRSQDPSMPTINDGVSVVEVLGSRNQSIQDFIVSNTTSEAGYIPGQSPYIASNPNLNNPVTTGAPSKGIPTAKCAYLDAACIAGTNQQQNPSKPMTLAERKAAGEYFGNLSTQYQRTAVLASATGNPQVVLSYEIAAGVAALLEQGFAPSMGKVVIDSFALDFAADAFAKKTGIPRAIVFETVEREIKPRFEYIRNRIDNAAGLSK